MVQGLAEPAQWPWLQPPPDGPRVPPEGIASVERQTGMVRHGPPPPPTKNHKRSLDPHAPHRSAFVRMARAGGDPYRRRCSPPVPHGGDSIAQAE